MWRYSLVIVCSSMMLIAFTQASQQPRAMTAPEQVRYSGSNGIELTYPSTWSRGGNPRVPEDAIDAMMIGKPDEAGNFVATFGCFAFDREHFPEQQPPAEVFARQTVAAARAQDPQAVLADVKPAKIGGRNGFLFELRRTLAGGTTRNTLNWTVEFNDVPFLITGSFAPDDEQSRRQILQIVEGLHFSDEFRTDDGQRVVFTDCLGRITFSHPSYWHDEQPGHKATLALWGIYDQEGTQIGSVNLMSDRFHGPAMTAEQLSDALQESLHKNIGKATVLKQRDRAVNRLSGHERIYRLDAEDGPRFVYTWISASEQWVIMLQGTVLEEERARFEKHWDATVDSIMLEQR